jgi:hypothetical protein
MKKKYKSNALLTDIENLPYYMHHAVLIWFLDYLITPFQLHKIYSIEF